VGWRLPKKVRVWTREDIRLLRELAERGVSVAGISARLKRSANAVRQRASIHGISIPAGDLRG